MIITRLDGGLGNQMFQYAYGFYLAKRHKTELLLDVSSYSDKPLHGFLLDRFNISARTVCSDELEACIPRRYRSQDSRRSWLDWLPGRMLRRTKEKPFGFSSRYLEVPDQRYLVGYWQSEKFFPGLRTELLREFALKVEVSLPSTAIAKRMQSADSIAIHIRRGDYVSNSAAAKIYCQQDMSYYTRAIEDWVHQQGSDLLAPEVFVFSNDPDWCRKNLQLRFRTTIVDHNSAATGHEDLWLMSLARCCVITNSTFSWWAAWLNQRDGRKVFAPEGWFQPGTLDGSSIVPEDWTILSQQRRVKAA